MNVLTGRQAVIDIKIDGVFRPVFCAIDVVLQYDHEEILKTSRNSGQFVERETRLCDWGVSVTGLTKIDNSDGQASFFWLLQQGVRGTEQEIRVRYTDEDSNQQDFSGRVLVKQGQLASAISGFSTATQFFPGTGAFSLLDNGGGFAPEELYKLYLDTTPDAYEVSHADLGGATEIMLVEREDAFYKEVSGTPSGRQVKFTDNTTSGTLRFDTSLPFNPGEIVYVEYKKPS